MNKKSLINPKCLLLLLSVFIEITISSQASSSQKFIVYAWEFTTSNNEINSLTKSFTNEFEEELIQSKIFTVLERRNFNKLLSHKDNERAILKIEDIPTNTLDSLKFKQANSVIFGEVFDDIESGQVKITATLQKFDGTSVSKNSVDLSRGKRFDAESRREKMKELVEKFREEKIVDPPDKGNNNSILEKTLLKISKSIKGAPPVASIYNKQLQKIVDSIQEQPNFEKQNPKITALAYRLYAASILLQPLNKNTNPLIPVDLSFPWLERTLAVNYAFKDNNEFKSSVEYLRQILTKNPNSLPMEEYLKHKFRIAMIEADEKEVCNQVYNSLIIILTIQRANNPNKNKIEKKELASIELGFSLGSKLILVTLPENHNNRLSPSVNFTDKKLKKALNDLGISGNESKTIFDNLQVAFKNPNNLMAASIVLDEINKIKDFLSTDCSPSKYASTFRIGVFEGYALENALVIADLKPNPVQVAQFETLLKKWRDNVPSDILIAYLPEQLTDAINKTKNRLKTISDIETQIKTCKDVLNLVNEWDKIFD
jgi:hypothetical protein